MAKPKGKVKVVWSPAFAYAIGLLVSDGNLSPDGRHIVFTSKDEELAQHFISALGIDGQHIGKKARGGEAEKRYFVVQFSDILFYRFLVSIGLMPNKSLVLHEVDVPEALFSHFVRGLFDGDGTTYSYWDTRWKSSFMYYAAFASGSPKFLRWLQRKIAHLYNVRGAIGKGNRTEHLTYAKRATKMLVSVMYQNAGILFLTRKHLKFLEAFAIVSTLSK